MRRKFIILIFILITLGCSENCQIADIATSKNNYALSFDGKDDFVIVQHDPSLNLDSAYTIEVWIYPYDVSKIPYGSHQVIVRKGNVYNNTEYVLYLLPKQGKGVVGFTGVKTEENSISDSTWFHIAGVFDLKNKSTKIFINGINISTNQYETFHQGHNDPLIVGASLRGNGDSFEDPFSGIIDELRIWNRALPLSEIRGNMYKKLSGEENGLVSYWPFKKIYKQVIIDHSGNNFGKLGYKTTEDTNDPKWVEVNHLSDR